MMRAEVEKNGDDWFIIANGADSEECEAFLKTFREAFAKGGTPIVFGRDYYDRRGLTLRFTVVKPDC